MILGVIDELNDCSFGVKFDDESKLELVKELALAGLQAWYDAMDDEIEDDEYFTAEEKETFYDDGYAEPASLLLDRHGIKHEITALSAEDFDEEEIDWDVYEEWEDYRETLYDECVYF